MVIAESLVPVYVWLAVRYTGEDLAFPEVPGRSFPKTFETGALRNYRPRSVASRQTAQMR
jgi:hypothetical protein